MSARACEAVSERIQDAEAREELHGMLCDAVAANPAVDDDTLIGVAELGLPEETPDPSDEFLEDYVRRARAEVNQSAKRTA